MRVKRYSLKQIIAKLRPAEKLQAEGLAIPQSSKWLGISDQTLISGGSSGPKSGVRSGWRRYSAHDPPQVLRKLNDR